MWRLRRLPAPAQGLCRSGSEGPRPISGGRKPPDEIHNQRDPLRARAPPLHAGDHHPVASLVGQSRSQESDRPETHQDHAARLELDPTSAPLLGDETSSIPHDLVLGFFLPTDPRREIAGRTDVAVRVGGITAHPAPPESPAPDSGALPCSFAGSPTLFLSFFVRRPGRAAGIRLPNSPKFPALRGREVSRRPVWTFTCLDRFWRILERLFTWHLVAVPLCCVWKERGAA